MITKLILIGMIASLIIQFAHMLFRQERMNTLREKLKDAEHELSEWKLRYKAVFEMNNDLHVKHDRLVKNIAAKTKTKFISIAKPVGIDDEEIDN